MKRGCVLTKNENFTEVGAASPGGRETTEFGPLLIKHKI